MEEMKGKHNELDLQELRKKIDSEDEALVAAFVARMRVCADIAQYKKEKGIPVLDKSREQEKLDKIRKMAPNDMEDSCVMLYNKVMELSRKFQQKIIDN